jgi:hypothetical protein
MLFIKYECWPALGPRLEILHPILYHLRKYRHFWSVTLGLLHRILVRISDFLDNYPISKTSCHLESGKEEEIKDLMPV